MTQFLGRNQLVARLAYQLGGDLAKAEVVLKAQGLMNEDGTLTDEGIKRDNMTAAERAISREAKRTGKPESAFLYDPATNKARVRGSFATLPGRRTR